MRRCQNLVVAKQRLQQVAAVAALLPGQGLAVAELAAMALGNSHALDPGPALATLCTGMVRHLTGTQITLWLDVWLAAGVVPNLLNAPVLVLNLVTAGATLTARALQLHGAAGEPYRISVCQLSRDTLSLGAVAAVYDCKDFTVLAVAAA